jgi:hypothetical protein
LSPKERKSSVFADRGPARPGAGRKDAGTGQAKAGPAKVAKQTARPLAELQERLEKEGRHKPGSRLTWRQRVAKALPLFGFIRVAEIGLAIIIIGTVTMIWIWPHLRMWGILGAIIGFILMRNGDKWIKGDE